jgi:hypothetical protein
MEPHVCAISQQGTDARGEWVRIANGGTSPVALTGLEITDFTQTQQHVHVFQFPSTTSGAPLVLGAGQNAFVFTGRGRNTWFTRNDGKQELHLFAGRGAPVWNNTGDVAYLRRLDGTFVDSLTVGAPVRHPNGH